ncbi:hypothetical protein GALMADRAFT_427599 [Galerina marginata CBS 339.88]|uniref:Uncharacterized protein n=1 Tax=Galerina marginata (strain CBS 339.88) TaxID=685588 RepID=A0A067T1S2_GALM3|nr:hypothetical protein GALMADRAFT_427599 [Galerina marginata CBS 339.88]
MIPDRKVQISIGAVWILWALSEMAIYFISCFLYFRKRNRNNEESYRFCRASAMSAFNLIASAFLATSWFRSANASGWCAISFYFGIVAYYVFVI